jgi:hypothetical protein
MSSPAQMRTWLQQYTSYITALNPGVGIRVHPNVISFVDGSVKTNNRTHDRIGDNDIITDLTNRGGVKEYMIAIFEFPKSWVRERVQPETHVCAAIIRSATGGKTLTMYDTDSEVDRWDKRRRVRDELGGGAFEWKLWRAGRSEGPKSNMKFKHLYYAPYDRTTYGTGECMANTAEWLIKVAQNLTGVVDNHEGVVHLASH